MNSVETHISSDVVIEITQLNKSFGNNCILRGVDFKLTRGENVVVLGRSGCGKSVFIKCISGLLRYDSGTIKVFNENISGINNRELDK
ncbi:MAG TPA: ATP-binding cassette domain-containing protein, partial [Bacteroidia bacterium]